MPLQECPAWSLVPQAAWITAPQAWQLPVANSLASGDDIGAAIEFGVRHFAPSTQEDKNG
ncbi:hypothetical protein HRW16_11215 [Streptomyces lunaelactis]|uniref:hypothetical protein n=1 Tax=Streptomyces lunaelactis TaxID=1535768 RepID=UPI001585D1C8|nr:hypothetical protein [Streptomyces lunaelactis]NUK34599.1 hypothetical protein [Streptomyces lunaelactis]NUK42008.1 hypothetical protein [Streptomyces lunaelactis]NUK92407.1 hypothetical protein [Streptomyces lunaelactis]